MSSALTRATLLALPLAFAGCAASARQLDSAQGVASMQPPSLPVQDEGWTALVQGDREMRALLVYRDRAGDPYVRDVVELQIAKLRGRINRLFEDLTAGEGRINGAAVRADVANLYRSMRASAAAEKQMEEPPPLRPPPP